MTVVVKITLNYEYVAMGCVVYENVKTQGNVFSPLFCYRHQESKRSCLLLQKTIDLIFSSRSCEVRLTRNSFFSYFAH